MLLDLDDDIGVDDNVKNTPDLSLAAQKRKARLKVRVLPAVCAHQLPAFPGKILATKR